MLSMRVASTAINTGSESSHSTPTDLMKTQFLRQRFIDSICTTMKDKKNTIYYVNYNSKR